MLANDGPYTVTITPDILKRAASHQSPFLSLFALLCFALFTPTICGQRPSLHGQVTDQSGAIVVGAKVTVRGPTGQARTATTDTNGSYSFANLPAGDYSVEASAPSLVLQEPVKITLKSGVQILNLQLTVFIPEQSITVQENNRSVVSTEAAANASAQVLRGEDLDALGDSPEDLQEALLALAGPSAGPSGGQIFIDGFSGGQLPSKNSIREIRINQNPFSPEYDKLGFGRIEILTKPGSGKFGGSIYYNFANRFWNSRNPYATEKAPFTLHELGGNLTGPINKKSSFFLDVRRDAIDNGSIVNAVILDPVTLTPTSFTDTPVTPQRRTGINPRIDYQINQQHTLVARYAFTHSDISEAGIGGFNLSSRAVELLNTSHTLQLTETAVINATTINETRFQFSHYANETVPNNSDPALLVLGSFNGGGAQTGHASSKQNSFELQNNTSIAYGKHFWRLGARLRDDQVTNISPQNFGGTFTFSGGNTLAPVVIDPSSCTAPGNPALASITSIEKYRRTLIFQNLGCSPMQIRLLGGGATQFTIGAGEPSISGSQFDIGLFVSDDWKVNPALTLNLGMRYETQSNIHDWRDFAPRLALAWAPGATAKTRQLKTVVRAGFGIFYDRFALANTLTVLRYNGVVQQQYVVTNPDFFPTVPPIPLIAAFQTPQTIQQTSPTVRAPYIMQSAVSVERQLPRSTTLAITYANAHGLHLLRSQDINAPLLGTYNSFVPDSGIYPLGRPGAVFQMESSGLYNQNQLIAFFNSRYSKSLSFSASYVLNFSRSDTDGLGTFPARPYDFTGEYGSAANDVRHRVTFNGTINTKWNVRLSPFVVIQSGPPFDITIGRDLYGTTLFNARPGIAADPTKPGLIQTKYGLLDPNPTLNQPTLTRNSGRGPGQLMVNLRVQKIFEFGRGENSGAASTGQPGSGPRAGTPGVFTSTGGTGGPASQSAGHRYSLSISMSIRNLINHTNPGPIIGNITSPLFGQANQPSDAGGFGFSESANNRRLELQTRLTF